MKNGWKRKLPALRNRNGFTDLGGFLVGLTLFVLLVVSLVVGIRYLDHRGAENSCQAYEKAWRIETEFVDYTFWNYDCLTVVDGQVVTADEYVKFIQLRELGEGK